MFRQSLPNCGITQTDTFGQPSWKKCRPFARHLDQWDPLPWWAFPHSLKDEHGLIGVWAQLHRGRANNHQVWASLIKYDLILIWDNPHFYSFLVGILDDDDIILSWAYPHRGWAFQCEGVLRPFRGQKIITDETFVEGWLGFKQTLWKHVQRFLWNKSVQVKITRTIAGSLQKPNFQWGVQPTRVGSVDFGQFLNCIFIGFTPVLWRCHIWYIYSL